MAVLALSSYGLAPEITDLGRRYDFHAGRVTMKNTHHDQDGEPMLIERSDHHPTQTCSYPRFTAPEWSATVNEF